MTRCLYLAISGGERFSGFPREPPPKRSPLGVVPPHLQVALLQDQTRLRVRRWCPIPEEANCCKFPE